VCAAWRFRAIMDWGTRPLELEPAETQIHEKS